MTVKIGWIGLGMIGAEMAKRLLGAGYAVTVYARGEGLEEVRASGAAAVSNYPSLASASDMLVLCVFSDAQVREVLYEQGTLASMRAGSILVIHTTGSPGLAREIASAAPQGVSVLDATFSGGPHDVAAGNLVMMVGGSQHGLERARPALMAYAREIHHLGAVGSGQVIKLLNNLLFATNLMNAAEALALAEDQGFDTAAIAGIIGRCSGGSYALARFETPLPTSALMARVRPYLEKDVTTAMTAAAASGLDVTGFAGTARYFQSSNNC